MTDQPTGSPVYIGDSVYLSDDGYQLWLSVGDHTNQVVALDHEVFTRLVNFGTVRFREMEDKET